jgi:predicted RNase H-like nuclease
VIVGVDCCRGGWLAVQVDPALGRWRAAVHGRFEELLAAHADAAAIGVDIPIGLPWEGPRACDREARRRLGPRRASVFPAPTRRLLALIAATSTYREANAAAWRDLGHGVGAQAFNIVARIREVDAALSPRLQSRVREVHPELCFAAVRGAPCASAKKTAAGAAERLAALGARWPWLGDARRAPRGAAPDDLLDALAAAWTAERIASGAAEALPADPELDPRGLRMEMLV